MGDDQQPQNQGKQQQRPPQGAQSGGTNPPPPSPAGAHGGPAGPTPGAHGQGVPFGGTPGAGGYAPPPPPEDTTPANYQIGQHLPPKISVQIPAHKLQFDEQYFLQLLAGSISLTKEEKKRIITSIPKLKQEQIDELIRIFEEERRKFAELSAKHVPQLQKLEKQHSAEWQDIELEQKAGEKAKEDEAQAEEIRKKLGL